MRKNQSNNDDDSLLEEYRRYLLNEMDKEEAESFEHRLLMEPDLPVEALDEDLLAACARKEFPPEQERQILLRLTSAPNGPDRALIQGITKLADEDQIRPRADEAQARPWAKLIPFRLHTWTQRHPHTLKTAMAAILVLAVVGVPAWEGWTAWRDRQLPPVVLPLALTTVRSTGTIPRFEVPSETQRRVKIRVDVAGEEYPSYNLVLTDVESGEEVAEENVAPPVQGGDVLTLELQASSLPQGEYQLYVYGTEASGPPEFLGAPEFEVLQSD